MFALGSTAYPQFCAFGKFIDQKLGQLGGRSLVKLTCGDELNHQERSFRTWLNLVFSATCRELAHFDASQSLDASEPETATIKSASFKITQGTEDVLIGISKN